MGYKRIDTVPNMMIDFNAANLYRFLSPDEKEIVWDALMDFAEQARKRDYSDAVPVVPADLSKQGKTAFNGMIESVCKGFGGYWQMCDRLSNNRNKANSPQQSDNSQLQSDNSATIVDLTTDINNCAENGVKTDDYSPQQSDNSRTKEGTTEGTTEGAKEENGNTLFGTFSQKDTTTEGTPQKSPDITPDILRLLMNSGFDMNAFDSLAISKIDGMVRDGTLTIETAKEVVDRCKTDNEINLQYFFFMLS